MNFSEGRQGGCGRTPLNPPLVAAPKIWNSVDPSISPYLCQSWYLSSSPQDPLLPAGLPIHLTALLLRLRFGFGWPLCAFLNCSLFSNLLTVNDDNAATVSLQWRGQGHVRFFSSSSSMTEHCTWALSVVRWAARLQSVSCRQSITLWYGCCRQ